MRELVLLPRFSSKGSRVTLGTWPALTRRRQPGQSHSKAPAWFSVGQIMSEGPNQPFHSPLLPQEPAPGAALAAGGLFSFIFICVFKEGSKTKKSL